ncbi:MAG: 3-dehydroquinate synthase [Clostridia bacterium]|nr:3-dehydroquinate synthase [Clostridia bacterium]
MKTVRVNASAPYDVVIGRGILDRADDLIPSDGAKKAAVISDDTVFPLYGERVVSSLEKKGLDVVSFTFPHGERSKNGKTFLDILEFFASRSLSRSDIAIALGGGVVGDIAGFTAATYLRGIRYAQIPTTLLSAVDSSVGGKCAIDLESGKNLAGAFHQPSAVVCDPDTLCTLTPDVFSEGCAEALKYGIITSPELLSHINEKGIDFDREYVISECVSIKADIVRRDEFDLGERALLNLGHTFGHGVERASGFGISHGAAVAIGISTVARGAEKLGISEKGTPDAIASALEKLSLPVACPPGLDVEAAFEAMTHDKKRRGETTTVVIPEKIGKCKLVPMNKEELTGLMKAGL